VSRNITKLEAAEIIAGAKTEKVQEQQKKPVKEKISAVQCSIETLDLLKSELNGKENAPDVYHVYKTETGLVHMVVTRKGTGKDKQIRPWVYDGLKWISKTPDTRILYNLDQITNNKESPVVIVEGEKPADIIIDGFVLTTWCGGAAATSKTDFSIFKDRKVYIVPDNDEAGAIAAKMIKKVLLSATVLDTSVLNVPEKWDLADSEDPKMDLKNMIFGHEKKKENQTVNKKPYRIVGEMGNTVCFFVNESCTVTKCSRSAITREVLKSIKNVDYWIDRFPKYKVLPDGTVTDIVTGVNWEKATAEIMEEARLAPKYEKFREKEGGYFKCGDDVVLHLGDRLIVNNKETKIDEYITKDMIFVRGEPVKYWKDPATDDDLLSLAKLFYMMQFENGRDEERLYFLSFCLFSRVYPVMYWKPSVWLKAPAGEGKTWLKDNVVVPLISENKHGIMNMLSPTEPSVRQDCDGKSWPVLIDEAEQKTHDDATIDKIMKLVRTTAGGGAEITRGSPDGTVKRFDVLSSFMFISILSGLKEQADKDRIALINYKKLTGEDWDRFEEFTTELLTPDFCGRVRTRIDKDHSVVIQNIKTITRILKKKHRMDQRSADQIGGLIGPALYCFAPYVWDDAKAFDMVKDYDFSQDTEHKTDHDENACMEELLNFKVRIEREKKVVITIRECISSIVNGFELYGIEGDEMKAELRCYLIEIKGNKLYYAANQENRIFQKSLYAMNFRELLKKHTALEESKPSKIGGGSYRCLIFDIEKLTAWEKFDVSHESKTERSII